MVKKNLRPFYSGPARNNVLIEESIERFGNDPRALAPNSYKTVVFLCVRCKAERESDFRASRVFKICLRCHNKEIAVSTIAIRAEAMKEYYRKGGKHPTRGIGHSEATKLKMSKSRTGMKLNISDATRKKMVEQCLRVLCNPEMRAKTNAAARLRRGPLSPSFGKVPGHKRKYWHTSPSGERTCFRSSWERNFAACMDFFGARWRYESETFPVMLEDGPSTYTPDFKVGSTLYEIKGGWFNKGLDKVCAFVTQYPWLRLEILDRQRLKKLGMLL